MMDLSFDTFEGVHIHVQASDSHQSCERQLTSEANRRRASCLASSLQKLTWIEVVHPKSVAAQRLGDDSQVTSTLTSVRGRCIAPKRLEIGICIVGGKVYSCITAEAGVNADCTCQAKTFLGSWRLEEGFRQMPLLMQNRTHLRLTSECWCHHLGCRKFTKVLDLSLPSRLESARAPAAEAPGLLFTWAGSRHQILA